LNIKQITRVLPIQSGTDFAAIQFRGRDDPHFGIAIIPLCFGGPCTIFCVNGFLIEWNPIAKIDGELI
jgi:hypothetical protein